MSGDLLAPRSPSLAFFDHRGGWRPGTACRFVPTGFRTLTCCWGRDAAGACILAARPGMGKTTVAPPTSPTGWPSGSGPVLFVSLEMDEEQLTAKRLSRLAGIPGTACSWTSSPREEYRKLAQASAKLQPPAPAHQPGAPRSRWDDIALLARQVKDLRLPVVDYIGKISPAGRGGGRTASST